jgi:hypothetical protein
MFTTLPSTGVDHWDAIPFVDAPPPNDFVLVRAGTVRRPGTRSHRFQCRWCGSWSKELDNFFCHRCWRLSFTSRLTPKELWRIAERRWREVTTTEFDLPKTETTAVEAAFFRELKKIRYEVSRAPNDGELRCGLCGGVRFSPAMLLCKRCFRFVCSIASKHEGNPDPVVRSEIERRRVAASDKQEKKPKRRRQAGKS